MEKTLSLGQRLHLTVEKLSLGGDGIARVPIANPGAPSHFVVFVPHSVPGDELEVEVIESRRTFARARIRQVLKAAAERAKPACPYYFNPSQKIACGGCNFQQISYAAQLREKAQMVRETLEKIGGVPGSLVADVLGAGPESEWRYRNKAQVPFAAGAGGETVSGFFAAGTHDVVPIDDCLIHPEPMLRLVALVKAKMKEWKLEPYSEKSGRGWLRHLLLRREWKGGKMLVTFVTCNEAFPRREEWCELIRGRFPEVTGICQNVNPGRTNVILGPHWKTLFGHDFLVEVLDVGGGALKLKVSAASFFQVNTPMAGQLYRLARDFICEGFSPPRAMLLDLYCGVGGIGLAARGSFRKVVGVDETQSSIRDANENARINEAVNCRFLRSDVADFLQEFPAGDESGPGEASDMVISLDPPRSGCQERVLRQILKIRPWRIVYVSCDPSTLARDLKPLCAQGYRVKKVQPVDLFPQSAHVETVAQMELPPPSEAP